MKENKKLKKDLKFLKKVKLDVEPSPEDERDYTIDKMKRRKAQRAKKVELPKSYQSNLTMILNQGIIGSCVAHSLASYLMVQDTVHLDNKFNDYSRGYIYGNRAMTDAQSEGMHIRQALAQLLKCGDVLYEDFPYNLRYPTVSSLIAKNRKELKEKAYKYRITNYFRVFGIDQIKECVYNTGACVIRIPIYSNFCSNAHPFERGKDKFEGYHAVIIVGWTEDNRWIIQNSWGKRWGYEGLGYMDFDYRIDESWGISFDSEHEIKEQPSKFQIFLKGLINFIKCLFKKKEKETLDK